MQLKSIQEVSGRSGDIATPGGPHRAVLARDLLFPVILITLDECREMTLLAFTANIILFHDVDTGCIHGFDAPGWVSGTGKSFGGWGGDQHPWDNLEAGHLSFYVVQLVLNLETIY